MRFVLLKMKGHKWTESEVKYLRAHWGKTPQVELAKHLNKSFINIGTKAKRIGLSGPYYKHEKNVPPPNQYGVIWRQSPVPHILASETGELWNKKRGAPIKTFVQKKTVVFSMMVNHKVQNFTVARFVYESFKGKVPKGMIVAHLDGNTLNNDLGNLVVVRRGQLSSGIAARNNSKRVVVYENGIPVRSYKSAKDYASKHFITYRSLLGHLNGEIKKSNTVLEDVRYSNEKVRKPEVSN